MEQSEVTSRATLTSTGGWKAIFTAMVVLVAVASAFVDTLEFRQASPVAPTMTVPDYFELDARLAWRINKNWEVAVIGQNLLHDRHTEFEPTYVRTQATEIPRSIFAQVTYQF